MRWYKILVLVVTPGIIIGVVLLITPILSIDDSYAAHVPDEEECVITLGTYNGLSNMLNHMSGPILMKQFLDDNPGFEESTCMENRNYIYEHLRYSHPEVAAGAGFLLGSAINLTFTHP